MIVELQADWVTLTDAEGIAPRTVVAIPPSDLDAPGLMRVEVDGVIITRAYDDELVQP